MPAWFGCISVMTTSNPKPTFLRLLVGVLSLTTCIECAYHVQRESPCDCVCGDSFMDATSVHKPICHVMSRFEKELLTVKQEIERRTVFIHDLAELKEIMEEQEDLIRNLQEQVEKISRTNADHETLPTPALLVMREEYMQGDASRENRKKEELANNVSSLIAKVEEVEHLTSKVQEELKSERRVRRHLEENLNETRFSIQMLDDKLLNVTLPMDSRVTHVEEIVLSTLDTMNRTLFDDHLKQLYYKVDGVVYKNETAKLDERLGLVETELIDVNSLNISSKIAEELNNFTEILSIMNQTIMGKLSEEESRLDDLENKTTNLHQLEELQDQMVILLDKTAKLDEIEGLQYRMSNLANVTESIQSKYIDLWSDIQNVRNTTVHLEKELKDLEVRSNRTVETVQQELSGQLDTLIGDLSGLKDEVRTDQNSLRNLQKELQNLSADVTTYENKVLNLSVASEKKLEEINSRIGNLSDSWDNSMSALATQIEEWKKSKDTKSGFVDLTENDIGLITQSKNVDDYDDADDEVLPVRMRGKGTEEKRCDLPSTDNENILVTLEEDSNGMQTLVFGCRPIGQYVLVEAPVPVQCMNGIWQGAFPACTRLKNESEIEALEMEMKSTNPCLYADGDIPDVTDCSYFFKCSHGFMHGRQHCPPGLHFDVRTTRCEHPTLAQCGTSLYMETKTLSDLIPTILIEPDNVDKPSGLMATGGSGHLIVYPKTSFKLHCLFPENKLGPPTWTAEHFSTGFPSRMHARNSKHRTTVEFQAPTSNFSGIYSCQTPHHKKNSITILVQAVTCPAFQVDLQREKALVYNNHPDGGQRILTTTAEFLCEGGSKITAMCLPNGTWSRPPPTIDECPPKRLGYTNTGFQRGTRYNSKQKFPAASQRHTFENETYFEIQVWKPGGQQTRALPSETRTHPTISRTHSSITRTHPSEKRTYTSVARTHPSEARTHLSVTRTHPSMTRTHPDTKRTYSRAHEVTAKIWGCEIWKPSPNDVLEVKYEEYRKGIRFNCPEGKRLVGGSSVACREGKWEPQNVHPRCIKL